MGDSFPTERKRVVDRSQQLWFAKEVKNALNAASPDRHVLLPGNLTLAFYLDFFGVLKNSLFDPRSLDGQTVGEFIMKSRQAEPFFVDTPADRDTVRKIVQAVVFMFQNYDRKLVDSARMDFDDQKQAQRAWLGYRSQISGSVALLRLRSTCAHLTEGSSLIGSPWE